MKSRIGLRPNCNVTILRPTTAEIYSESLVESQIKTKQIHRKGKNEDPTNENPPNNEPSGLGIRQTTFHLYNQTPRRKQFTKLVLKEDEKDPGTYLWKRTPVAYSLDQDTMNPNQTKPQMKSPMNEGQTVTPWPGLTEKDIRKIKVGLQECLSARFDVVDNNTKESFALYGRHFNNELKKRVNESISYKLNLYETVFPPGKEVSELGFAIIFNMPNWSKLYEEFWNGHFKQHGASRTADYIRYLLKIAIDSGRKDIVNQILYEGSKYSDILDEVFRADVPTPIDECIVYRNVEIYEMITDLLRYCNLRKGVLYNILQRTTPESFIESIKHESGFKPVQTRDTCLFSVCETLDVSMFKKLCEDGAPLIQDHSSCKRTTNEAEFEYKEANNDTCQETILHRIVQLSRSGQKDESKLIEMLEFVLKNAGKNAFRGDDEVGDTDLCNKFALMQLFEVILGCTTQDVLEYAAHYASPKVLEYILKSDVFRTSSGTICLSQGMEPYPYMTSVKPSVHETEINQSEKKEDETVHHNDTDEPVQTIHVYGKDGEGSEKTVSRDQNNDTYQGQDEYSSKEKKSEINEPSSSGSAGIPQGFKKENLKHNLAKGSVKENNFNVKSKRHDGRSDWRNDRAWKIMEIIMKRKPDIASQMLKLEPFTDIMGEKWKLVEVYHWLLSILYMVMLVGFTVVVAYRNTPFNSCEELYIDYWDFVRLGFEIFVVFVSVVLLSFYLVTDAVDYDKGFITFKTLRPVEVVFKCLRYLTCISIFTALFFRITCSPNEDVPLALGLFFGWIHSLKCVVVYRPFGMFAEMIWAFLYYDLLRFLVVYMLVLTSVSSAFLCLFQGTISDSSTGNFSQFWISAFNLFRIGLGLSDDVDMVTTARIPAMGLLMFCVFVALVPIIMFNILIPMLADTYSRTRDDIEVSWPLIRAHTTLSLLILRDYFSNCSTPCSCKCTCTCCHVEYELC